MGEAKVTPSANRHAASAALRRRTFLGSAGLAAGAAILGTPTEAQAQTTSPIAGRDLPRRQVQTGGFGLEVIDVGDGPAVLMLHGFPSSSLDWRHQIPALVSAGYRVVAPDLLGLGKSDKPEAAEHYTVTKDVERTLDLLSALNVQKARIVCHDRGAGIGWNIAAHHPEQVEQLVAMAVGHSNVARNPSIAQREQHWYMLLFQFAVAEKMLRADNWRLFRGWMRNHPDIELWIDDLSAPGALTASLGWYRANRNPEAAPGPPLPDVTVPALGLWAAEDHYLLPEYMLESYRYVRGPWRTERIDGATHFMMLDRPDHVTKLILDFFAEGATPASK
jgi:pimeloyl-ACP methyl ester carboxylesterase